MIRNMQALFPDPNKIDALMFTPELLKTVETKILESCDKQDGIGDGVIDDPTAVQGRRQRASTDDGAEKRAQGDLRAHGESGRRALPGPAVWRGRADGRLANLDHWRQAARGRPGAEPAFRVRHGDRQVPGLQRSELGLQQVQLRELEEGFSARGELSQRHQPRSQRLQLAGRPADSLARLGRSRR